MGKSYKVLGQSAPSATTNTDVYTVPSSTQAVISTITVANRSSSSITYRLAVRPNGASISNQHYIAFGASVSANDTVALTLGITVNATDVITIWASSVDVSFNLFGSEIS
jgi:hypothetical protein